MPLTEGAPPISGLDDIWTMEDVAEYFGCSIRTVSGWRWGGNGGIRLPYFRIAKKIWFSRSQVVWFMNEIQKQADLIHMERISRRRKARKE